MAVQGIKTNAGPSDVHKDSIMNSVDRYRHEWTGLKKSLGNYEAIQLLGFNGDLKVSKFRSIYWALLLRVLNGDHNSWSEQRFQQRKRYDKLKQEFAKNPHIERSPNDDPLSQSEQSVWNQYFSDQELVAVIKQDVVRTFPGVDFFRKPLIQDSMISILFCYAREHPYMCYRQGMHEILAPILFVLYGDHQALLHFSEVNHSIDTVLMDVLNPEFIEADSYTLFARVMSSIESYYRITNLVQSDNGYFCVKSEPSFTNSLTREVEVISQLNTIRDKILAKEDLHLHNYLLKLDIPLHIFGIRWLRLLFGREFALLDLLVLWDAIFADGDRFDLPNYILVAMLIRIRDKLLCNDYTTCLTYLMRYPSNVDINLILRHALYMQQPKKFDRPANAFVYFTMNTETPQPSLPMPQKTLSTTVQPLTNEIPSTLNSIHLKPEIPFEANRRREMKFQDQIADNQYKNAWDSAVRARLKATPESDKVIVDGYSENSPEILRLELENAQTIINISKCKLQSYLNTIKRNLSKNSSEQLCQAVDGIEELCSFLDVKFIFPLRSRSQQIDQALEADESRQLRSTESRDRRGARQMANGNASTSNSRQTEEVANEEEGDAEDEEEDDEDADISVSIIVSGTTVYEKPDDNRFAGNTNRIFGNRREVELIPIATIERLGTDRRLSIQGVPSIDPLGYRDD